MIIYIWRTVIVNIFVFAFIFLFACLVSFILGEQINKEEGDDPSFDVGSSPYKVVYGPAKVPRYLLYGVNEGEGFNLRRDVYMRMAVLGAKLNQEAPWILVLPPWGRIYHWKSRDLGPQMRIPWSTFFDVPSLRQFVPVMEFEEFLKISPEPPIDELYYLKSHVSLQQNGEVWDKWEEKIERKPCNIKSNPPYYLDSETGLWTGWFFGYDEVSARNMECLHVTGHASIFKPFLLTNTTARSVMLDRAETLLHDHYGDRVFWECRRSMRFASHLRNLADDFRRNYLNSTDEEDKTVLEEDWQKMKRKHGQALGGPYLAAHLRREDFLHSRSKYVPSLKSAAKQLDKLARKLNLDKIYISTDAPYSDFQELKSYLPEYSVYRYQPSEEVRQKYKDGGMAIIDQWMSAHARHFIGSYESTFSFRIQDEREILGFDPSSTFNCFCRNSKDDCDQPTKWLIEY